MTLLVLALSPPESFGYLRLFMSREAVHDALCRDPTTVPAQPDVEYYDDIGLVLAFQDANCLTRIAANKCEATSVLFQGVDLFRTPARRVLQVMSTVAPFNDRSVEVGWTYTFPKLNLQLHKSVGPRARYFDVVVLERRRRLRTPGPRLDDV